MASLTPVASTDALLEAIKKSGLLDADALAKVEAKAAAIADPKQLARELIREGVFTKWQAQQLLHGFFLLVVGKYKLLDQIGAGEMGRVYLAEHVQMGRRHAIKILSNRHTSKPDVLKRFLDEAQRVCALDHRNLRHSYDVNQDGNKYFLVMEYVEGQDLQKLVDESGPLSVGKAIEYIAQAAEGLAHAHEHDMVHGDLKPGNLLLDRQGTIKILDIGQARLTESPVGPGNEESIEMANLEAVIHHAPEQRGTERVVTRQSDVYSLGSIFCFLLTGKAVPDATAAKHHLEVKKIPNEIAALCQRMMAAKAAERPQSMAEVLTAVIEAAKAIAAPVLPPMIKPKTASSKMPAAEGPKPDTKGSTAGKPKKPPVAKPLEATEEPLAEGIVAAEEPATSATPAEGFGSISIQTVDRPSNGGKPAAKPATKPTPATDTSNTKPAGKKGLPMPLAIGGLAIAALVLIVGGAVGGWLYFSGGDETSKLTANASVAGKKVENEKETPATEPTDESAETSAETNPELESNPVATTAATKERTEPSASDQAAASHTKSEPASGPPAADTAKPADKKEPEKTAATTDTKADAAKPDAAKTEPPKTDATKPPAEPPKTEPTPAPAAPAPNPFAKLPPSIDLPKLDPSASEPSPESLQLEVGPLNADPKTPIYARLIGGESAIRGGKLSFTITAADGGTAFSNWEIGLEGGDMPVLVAQLGVADGKLKFNWTAEGAKNVQAPQLCNCAINFDLGDMSHRINLRKPLIADPLVVEIEKPAIAKWNIEHLPDLKSVFVEIVNVEGFEKSHRFDPDQQLEANKDETMLWTGATEDAQVLGFKLESKANIRGIEIESAAHVKLDFMEKPKRYVKKDMKTWEMQFDQQSKLKNAQIQAVGKPGKDDRAKQQLLTAYNKELELINRAGEHLEHLKGMFTSLPGKGTIHFRVYYETGEGQIDLLTTGAVAAAAAPPAAAAKK